MQSNGFTHRAHAELRSPTDFTLRSPLNSPMRRSQHGNASTSPVPGRCAEIVVCSKDCPRVNLTLLFGARPQRRHFCLQDVRRPDCRLFRTETMRAACRQEGLLPMSFLLEALNQNECVSAGLFQQCIGTANRSKRILGRMA